MIRIELGSERWLRVVFLATALVFAGVAVYVFAFDFAARLHPDDAVMALLAEKVLDARVPVVDDWYYGNGDVWVLGPQLIALLPVAIGGLGAASLLVATVAGFLLQLAGIVRAYLWLAGERWIALFAALAVLMAWSSAHVDYVYVQMAYGFVTCLYLLAFAWFATLAERAGVRAWQLALPGLLVAAIAVQNPTRAVVYILAPLVVACAWPWRRPTFPVRKRLLIAAAATAGWLLAYAVYTWVLLPAVELSIPRGHGALMIVGRSAMRANLELFERGLVILLGGGDSWARALPGTLLVTGALALVGREVFASRAFTALRGVSVIVLAQLGGVIVPLIASTLLTDKESVRYVLPSLLAVLGLAVVIAVRAAGDAGSRWWRRFAIGWLCAVPLAALAALPGARPQPPEQYIRPDAAELEVVADELVRRGLTRGFSINIAANLLTLHSRGAARTCPVYFSYVVMPHRWLADTRCFTASRLPERFYMVADRAEHERGVIRATIGPEVERFSVGDTYEVHVFRTAEARLGWLELPILDGPLATFPLRLPATHLQIGRDQVAVEAGELVATGTPGTVLYGPYIDLPRGDYEVSWIGDGVDSSGGITFQVTRERRLIAQRGFEARELPRARGELVRIPFTLRRPRNIVELVIESRGGGRVSIHELVIEQRR